jgi:hypothetical protein
VPDLAGLVRVIHAPVGILFVGSLIGRGVVLGEAARATTVADVKTMLRVSSRFETTVIWSSTVVLVPGIATAIAQGRPFLGPLRGHQPRLALRVAGPVPVGHPAGPARVPAARAGSFEQALAEAEATGG